MKLLGVIGFGLAIIMVALNLYPSWSQYARTLEEPLLLGCLWSISATYMLRSQRAINRNMDIIKSYSVKDLDVLTSVFFGLVLCTPVTHSDAWIQTAHYIFTGLAVLTAYLNLVLQQTDKAMKIATKISFGLALVIFPVGLLTDLITVGMAELAVSAALLIHIVTTKTDR